MALRMGFDRQLKLIWLDELVAQLLNTDDKQIIRDFLHERLVDDHPAQAARDKTVAVLMRMWVNLPDEHKAMQQQALTLVQGNPGLDLRWLHWGMALMAFPLFHSTTSIIGRLLTVQGDFSKIQVQRRLAEIFGQCTTLERASRRVIRSIADWDLLNAVGQRGDYQGIDTLLEAPVAVQLWLLEALIRATKMEGIEINQLLSANELFPCHITVKLGDLRNSERFTLHRQGINMDIATLRSM